MDIKFLTDELRMTRAELARWNNVSYKTAQNWYTKRSHPPRMVFLYLELLYAVQKERQNLK